MRLDLKNLGLQDLSTMLINKNREFAQLVEKEDHDHHTMHKILIELENLHEVISAYWELKKRITKLKFSA